LVDTVCPTFTHTFVNTSIGANGYSWNFGDGTSSTLATPSHSYATPGTYTITLIISNATSCNKLDTAIQVLHIKPSITSLFTTTKTDTCGPYKISILNNSSINTLYAGAATWTKYLWTFGDGTSSILANPNMHTYNLPGTYTITLRITDSTSCNSPQVFTQVVTFVNNNIATDFVLPDTACLPYTHLFLNNTVNPNLYNWNFGGTNTSTNPIPSFTFNNLGTYTVNLIVSNALTCNKADSEKHIITIVPRPTANFYFLPNPPLANKSVSFSNQSTGAVRYLWDFGDGTSSTLENPTHLYNKSANLDVCLTAFNQYNCADTTCLPIRPQVVNIVDVPTGFSPNGDGQNDFVQVRGYGIKEMNFRIYNRFGELVFEGNKLTDKWDGMYKAEKQEMETYAYILVVTFTDFSTTTKKGNITLIK
jgi:gliding motility-associated-like protein